jgi:glycosyltransferase involved in cell wall biosynthesis
VYGTSLGISERANAYYKEVLVRRWQRRPDAHSLFTMEEPAVQRWSRPHAAPAYYLPEPPLSSQPATSAAPRQGVLVCGAIRPQKNIETIARALSTAPPGIHLVIAGDVYPSYRPTVHALAAQMRAAGVRVTLRLRWHSSQEILDTLARARCLLIPALRHKGTSHTLVEAAAAGTPVIVHAGGLLGYTVRRHGLGLVIDCRDPDALRSAIVELAESDATRLRFAPNLADFAARHSLEAFSSAICAPFGVPALRYRHGGSAATDNPTLVKQ